MKNNTISPKKKAALVNLHLRNWVSWTNLLKGKPFRFQNFVCVENLRRVAAEMPQGRWQDIIFSTLNSLEKLFYPGKKLENDKEIRDKFLFGMFILY